MYRKRSFNNLHKIATNIRAMVHRSTRGYVTVTKHTINYTMPNGLDKPLPHKMI